METLVIVADHHRNQYYYRRGKSHHHHHHHHLPERFSSSPSRGFKEINCRAFQSGTGILPTPFKSFNTSYSSSLNLISNKKASSSSSCSSSPTTTTTSSSPSHRKSEKYFENNGKTIPIPIKIKPCNNEKSFNNGYSLKSSSNNKKPFSSPPTSPPPPHREINGKSIPIPINLEPLNTHNSFTDDLSYSELWAGPAYSNSPPPSSLPIPTFSLRRQKRSVSVEIPVLRSEIIVHPVAKSAPPSPTRGLCRSPDNFCLSTTASATKDLRRILHLDAGDE